MKRAMLCLALALAACATAPPPPPERVAGCWIDRGARGEPGPVTMRWLPDDASPGALIGDRLNYSNAGPPENVRYRLEPRETFWRLCELNAENGEVQCWRVAQGESGMLEGGRAFIDAHGDRLRIAILGAGPERVIFYGNRDGCD
jgi:hypothetical protein